jgi:hypothetical protein
VVLAADAADVEDATETEEAVLVASGAAAQVAAEQVETFEERGM